MENNDRIKFCLIALFLLFLYSDNLIAQRSSSSFIAIDVSDTLSFLHTDSITPPYREKSIEWTILPTISNLKSNNNDSLFLLNNYYDAGNIIPTRQEIDRYCDVGEIPFTQSTTPNGSLEINVPIDVVKTADGFDPSLFITYNNTVGDGPLGFGWKLSGVSRITRGNKSIYYDDETAGVENDNDDAFFLDAIRLIKISATATQIQYQSAQGRVKVIASVVGDHIQSFTAFYPNGNCALFETSSADCFYITRITNHAGRAIEYEYEFYNNHFRLKAIYYGLESIHFDYVGSRSDNSLAIYPCGKKTIYDYLLSGITTFHNTTLQRHYKFYYATRGFAYVISKIECSKGAKFLNPLSFYYTKSEGDGTKFYQSGKLQLSKWYQFKNPSDITVSRGKFMYGKDEDGLVVSQNKSCYIEHYVYSPHVLRLESQYDGTEDIYISTGLNTDLDHNNSIKSEKGFIDVFCMDTDADGVDEIVKINNFWENGNKENLSFTVYNAPRNLSGVGIKEKESFSITDGYKDNIIPKYFYTGDFNGDGKEELIAVTSQYFLGREFGTKCVMFDLDNNKTLYNASPFNFNVTLLTYGSVNYDGQQAYNLSDKLIPFDYNGDGKTDLALIKNDSVYVYSFVHRESELVCMLVNKDGAFNKSSVADRELLVGDFNGDNKSDFLLSPLKKSGNLWQIFASKGDGSFDKIWLHITERLDGDQFILQDMNGDGQTDLVQKSGKELVTCFLANFKGQDNRETEVSDNTLLVPVNVLSGDRWFSLLNIHNDGVVDKLKIANGEGEQHLLTACVSSYGLIHSFNFTALNINLLNEYTPGYGATFPYRNFMGPLYVCTSIKTRFNDKLLHDIHTVYADAILHLQGLGFRGFKSISSQDFITGTHEVQTYDPYHFGNLLSEETEKSKYEYSYNISVGSNKIAEVSIARKTFEDKVKSIKTSTIYTYDNYGNMTTADVDYGDGLSSHLLRSYHNVDDGISYQLGLVASEKRTLVRNGLKDVQSVINSFDERYNLIAKDEYSNDSIVGHTDYFYGTDNRIRQKNLRKYTSSTLLANTFEYDQAGRLKSRTNAFGFKDVFEYNENGMQSRVTDHLGNSILSSYDDWGRVASTIYPDSMVKSGRIEWSNGEAGSLYKVIKVQTNKPVQTSYIDALGNEVRSSEQRFDGSTLFVDKKYDERNRLSSCSYPFKSSPEKWITYKYDNYDRPLSIDYDSGKMDQYSYFGLTKNEKKNGVSISRTYNSLGELLSQSDEGGSIHYEYNGAGKIISVVTGDGFVTRMAYDSYNRLVKKEDPSTGVTIITYDNAGNKSREINGRGQANVYQYDGYDRLVKKTIGNESPTHYVYDKDNHLVKRFTEKGYSISFVYDKYERIISEKEQTNMWWLQKDYTYFGDNIKTITYNSYFSHRHPIGVEHYNYSNGTLASVSWENINIYTRIKEDEQGRETENRSGKIVHSTEYDDEGRVLSIEDRYNALNTLQKFSYTYDSTTGNMLSRTDDEHQQIEFFSYDKLNRLTVYGNDTIEYAGNGNILSTTSSGYYNYGNLQPYAVKSIFNIHRSSAKEQYTYTYNAQNFLTQIAGKKDTAMIVYNGEGDRVYFRYVNHINFNNDYAKLYFGDNNYEVHDYSNNPVERIYLGGNVYTANCVLSIGKGDIPELFHILRDNLGSVTLVANDVGNIFGRYSYDPWGRLRDPDTYEVYNDNSHKIFFDRGYCGHEYIGPLGLVNMNARFYDPSIGRFLSADPLTIYNSYSQALNGYSYCLNNPLVSIFLKGPNSIENLNK